MQAPATETLARHDGAAGGSCTAMPFEGFDPPESNFWRLPNNWFDIAACFTSWAEHKVVEYILRHTWGYHEYDICKLITMDEFMHGRKRRDGSRLDAGCGMAENSIKKGIADAVAHGFLIVEVDDSDRGRIKKFYAPRMRRPQRDEGAHAARPVAGAQAEQQHMMRGTADRETAVQMPTAQVVERGAAAAQPQSLRDQRLRVQGQSLTPEDHSLMGESAHLTPDAQQLTPHQHSLTLRTAASDPRTGKESPVQHLRKATRRQQTRLAAVPFNPEHAADQRVPPVSRISPVEEDALRRLIAEGITATRARALVDAYPAERILRQLDWIDARSYQNRQATLIAAIERDYAAPASRRANASASGEPFDAAKFHRGIYAVCPQCSSRPCICAALRDLPAARR